MRKLRRFRYWLDIFEADEITSRLPNANIWLYRLSRHPYHRDHIIECGAPLWPQAKHKPQRFYKPIRHVFIARCWDPEQTDSSWHVFANTAETLLIQEGAAIG